MIFPRLSLVRLPGSGYPLTLEPKVGILASHFCLDKLFFKINLAGSSFLQRQVQYSDPIMSHNIRLALNADTTPLSVSDTLIFKSLEERAREASQAGFTAVNVDRSEPALTVEKARHILADYSLEPASGWFHGRFYDASLEEEIYRQAEQQADFSSRLGQECLFVSDYVFDSKRHDLAGRIQEDHPISLNEGQMAQMVGLLHRIARLWVEFDLVLCYHPHAGTYIEAPHEIEWLMELTDPALVRFGPDTGHLFYGGADPLDTIERHFERAHALHIKDVRAEVLLEVREKGLSYRQACARGVWTELGTGDIDFPALFRLLEHHAWEGWVIVETDHTRLASALESSKVSREYLRREIGI